LRGFFIQNCIERRFWCHLRGVSLCINHILKVITGFTA
jgi:hypothetical protein